MGTSEFATLHLALIVPSLTNPRKTFNEKKLQELTQSIQTSGVHQPVLVRPLPGHRAADTAHYEPRPAYELVCGERRYRASALAGKTDIPAMVKALTDDQVLEIQIVENLQRDDLTDLEEAEGYQQLMDHSNLSAEQVAEKIGKSRSYVYARTKLLDLCSSAKDALRAGVIDSSKALLLARIPSEVLQLQALKDISRMDYNKDPAVGFRAAQKLVQENYMLRLDKARFKITDATLTEAGSCKTCIKRTGHNPELFDDVKSADVCTDPPCYKQKESAHQANQLKAAHDRGQTVIAGREARELMPNSWGSIDGYVRLDDERDSPTDKPLRKLIGRELDMQGIQPVLIQNPHKEGELIAAIPKTTAAELLKAKGQKEAAESVEDDIERAKRDELAQAKRKEVEVIGKTWRMNSLIAVWQKLQADTGDMMNINILRLMAIRHVRSMNKDKCKDLSKVLDLGKVAHSDALMDIAKTTPHPAKFLQLLLAHADTEYRNWLPGEGWDDDNALKLLTDWHSINIEALKNDAKQLVRAKTRAEKKAIPPTAPAAQPKEGAGGKKQAVAPARKKPEGTGKRPTKEEVTLGIAVALQDLEEASKSPQADPEGEPQTTDAWPFPLTDADPLLVSAVTLIKTEQKVSVRQLKENLSIGTTKAMSIINELEKLCYVSTCDERGARKVLVQP